MSILRSIILIILMNLALFAQAQQQKTPRFPVLKSALLPGWGEHSYQSKTRGYLFNGIEASLWIIAGIAHNTANSHQNDLYYFAAEYGQITDPQSKSDIFLDRVSKFESMDEYNEQMLRNRQWDRIYSAENGEYWQWESTEKRQEYFNIKTRRYQWRQAVTYTFGAIALNHLVSTMDALYLKRRDIGLSVQPEIGKQVSGLRLNLSF